jgi:mannose-1-phosphate guanylyltransferase/mannose-6-phosphate isomerase
VSSDDIIIFVIIVVIAGGSGTRLWPLSTHNFPKHLLKLINEKSLLQNTYERIKDLSDNILVIPEKSHAKHVFRQLPDLPRKNVLIEPARRGTASCFVLALSEIKRRKLPEQSIFFLWADHLVGNKIAFTQAVNEAARLAETENRLVFLGIKPAYASTGFGYIQKGRKLNFPRLGTKKQNVYELKQFVEKPNIATAKHYLKSRDYLWNSGYLAGTLNTFERELREHAPRLWNDYQALLSAKLPLRRRWIYLDFVSEPIDTALSEHVPDGLVLEASFDWTDVGSFHDLHTVSGVDKYGNAVVGKNIELENVSSSYVRNEADIPLAVIGLDNVAVIATENGVLVTNKAHAQKVGEVSKKIQSKKGVKWYEKL